MKRFGLQWLALAAAVMLLGNGCIIVGTNCGAAGQVCCGGTSCNAGNACGTDGICRAVVTGRNPYETCSIGEACLNGSTCRQANIALSGSTAGNQCSTTCTTSTQCPLDVAGRGGICLEVTGSGTQCYRGCTSDAGCGTGFRCAQPAGTTSQVCIPMGTPACGNNGEACCAGNACNTGLGCNGGVCQPLCGAVGQPCCAGATACGAGAACVNNVCVAAPTAYQGCTPIGTRCGDNTTCQAPMIANPGATGWCTASCLNASTMCPALPGSIVDCYILQGTTQGQCYVACPSGAGCPNGTQCVMTDTATATGVRLCMPPVT